MRLFGIFLRTQSVLDKVLHSVAHILEGEPILQNIRYFSAWDLMKFTGVFVESFDGDRTSVEQELIKAYTARGTAVFIIIPGEKSHTVAGYFKDAPTPVTFSVSVKATPAQWAELIQEQWDVLIASVTPAEEPATETEKKTDGDAPKFYGEAQLSAMTVEDLKAFAKDKNVELSTKATKAVIVETLVAANIPLA